MADSEGDFTLQKWLCGLQLSPSITADTLKLEKKEKINDPVFGFLEAPQEIQRKQDSVLFIKIYIQLASVFTKHYVCW